MLFALLLACTEPIKGGPPEPDPAPDTGTADTGTPVDTADTPVDTGTTKPPCGVTLDTERLDAALSWLESNTNYIDSMLVYHCGEPVVATYRNGYDADTPHDMQSATKTFAAVLIGIAMQQGLLDSIDTPLSTLLPDHAHLLTGEKAEITLYQVLTMTTGLRWVDFGVENSFDRIADAEDSVAFVLSEPLTTPPGDVFAYNTGSSHLLSAVITAVTGQSAADYAATHLFAPLGMAAVDWPALSDGVNQGGWGIHMRPVDFAAMGQLLLDHGVHNSTTILSEDFVDAATLAQVDTGYGGYGYQMWIEPDLFDAADIAAARGYGGQDCFVLEELDMVVVFTGSIDHPVEMAGDVRDLMNGFIIPAHPGAG